jgi:aspartate/methionine/tyrosine aminotransferase
MIISAFFSCAASPATTLWATLLSDRPYLDYFLKTNRLKLKEAYEHMTSWLRFHKLPYLPTSAGHFLLVDMRPILSDTQRYGPLLSISRGQGMREREAALLHFLAKRGVWLTPGSACHTDNGWFRFTFSLRRDFTDVALARIEDALGWKRWIGSDEHVQQEQECQGLWSGACYITVKVSGSWVRSVIG